MQIRVLAAVACVLLAAAAELAAGEQAKGKVPYIEIGKVRVYRAEKKIVIPAVVAVRSNLIELFACAEGGKVHESVLLMECRPSNLNLAFKLLEFDDGGQIPAKRMVKVEENGVIVEKEIEWMAENGPNYLGDPTKPVGDRVIVTVSWDEGGERKTVRAEDMIFERIRNRTMPRAGWVYTGSRFVRNPRTGRDEFMADHSKTVMSTWHDPDAILDNPLPDGWDDDVYYANPDVVPERGTPVLIEIVRPKKDELAQLLAVEAEEEKASAERNKNGGRREEEK